MISSGTCLHSSPSLSLKTSATFFAFVSVCFPFSVFVSFLWTKKSNDPKYDPNKIYSMLTKIWTKQKQKKRSKNSNLEICLFLRSKKIRSTTELKNSQLVKKNSSSFSFFLSFILFSPVPRIRPEIKRRLINCDLYSFSKQNKIKTKQKIVFQILKYRYRYLYL